MTDLLTRQEAADRLRIGMTKLKALTSAGLIETVVIGRRVFIPADAVEAYLQSLRAPKRHLRAVG